MKDFLRKINWKKIIKLVIILVILVVGAKYVLQRFVKNKVGEMEATAATAMAEKRDIKTTLSSSGTIQPLNTYEVTSLVDGEILKADFEEGDQVEKGDVLYQVATDSVDTKIDSAKTSVERAEDDYEDAVESYNKAVSKYKKAKSDLYDLNIKAKASGMVTKVYVEKGDKIQQGTQLADVYDNTYMLLEVPFNADEVENSWVGKEALVEAGDYGEELAGKVTKVAREQVALSGNRVVRYVTIQVKNPGGITTETVATASVDAVDCNSEGTFSVLEQTTLTADKSGEIKSLKLKENGTVSQGDVIVVLSDKDARDQLESYQDSIDNAKKTVDKSKESIEDAKKTLDDQEEVLADYSITAPISGQVIRKNTLVGDTIKSTGQTTAMCVIYDLSAVTFEMSIDELDVMSIKTGQEVAITADALSEQTFTGIITNISLESTTNGGVTQYPVTVRIDHKGDLLPGMNVTGEIVTEEALGVLAVPVDALMRGDVVYVKDAGVPEEKGEAAQADSKAEGAESKGNKKNEIPDGFHSVSVETGLTDGDYIEIKSGLNGDEEVYVARNTSENTNIMMPGMSMEMGSPMQEPDGGRGGRSGGGQGGNMGGRPN